MPDSNTFNIGGVNGGQNNFGGDHNTFNQQVYGVDAAAVAQLLGRVREHLADFPDPVAAGHAVSELQAAPAAELAHPGRLRSLLEDLHRYAPDGTAALAAVAALVAAVHGG
ncbi:hypothetical protein ACWT_2492 [Actinoplanes sp. SE50]|uniref:hypothetical protein n=1 Tax=unclassified Actinoplanes TaxID=2626549 RepID=UPI00023ED5D8|nr:MULTISPECIES: hypothetical protein [unclassified Actinoplanes]AEV83949.1 hypothetical protein ACPL_3054 [Actinoplanes sp. SE50/110]ATO81907.1 hypothetical protein ACWT_2492 [Actinoplanes sp. SE50]SLL99315.1 hypothetical protein ACSP50_2546 [Actinoplanes sp. SE50/110]